MRHYTDFDDHELVCLLQKGDELAFTEIYNRYWKKLFSVAAHKLGNLSDAEEIVQDIFMEIWNRHSQFVITSSLGAYLSTAAGYRVINVLAKRNVQKRYQQYAGNMSAVDTSTEQWLSYEELKDELMKHIAALPEKCRLVYKLSREEGMSHKEIAQQLGISEKTVEAHIGKALQVLRVSLGSNMLLLFYLSLHS